MIHKKRIVFGITGASGAIYAQRMLKLIENRKDILEVALIISASGKEVWHYELGVEVPISPIIKSYPNDSFFAPPASGSAGYDAMIVIPCTMGTLGRIAHGTSNELITRSADVMLKERKPLILVVRESPFSLIHIENMRLVTLAGGVILPASPSFYSIPGSIEELVDTVVHRAIGMLGLEVDGFRWGREDKGSY